MTRIFYLVLLSLTAAAAAVQWMPRDGFPPDLDLGPEEARAQAGPQTRTDEPVVRTAEVRRAANSPSNYNGPMTIYPAQPPAAAPPSQPAYPTTSTPGAFPSAAPNRPVTTSPTTTSTAPTQAPPSGLPGTSVFPASQFPPGQYPAGTVTPSTAPYTATPTIERPSTDRPAAAYPSTGFPPDSAPTAGFPPGTRPADSYPVSRTPATETSRVAGPPMSDPSTAPTSTPYAAPPMAVPGPAASYVPRPVSPAPPPAVNPPPTSYRPSVVPPPVGSISPPVERAAAPTTDYSNTPGFDPFGPPGTAAAGSNSPVGNYGPPGANYSPAGGNPPNPVASVSPGSQTPLPIAGPSSYALPVEQELSAARVLARVGGEVITQGEVDSSVNSLISRQGHDFNSPEVMAQREALVRMRLNQLIEMRSVLHEARRKIPAEALKTAMEKFDEDFDKTVVPQMLKERKLADTAALNEALKKEGTTLERMRRDFAETVLYKSWLQQRVEYSTQVTHEEMLDHYQKNLAQYEFTAECRWEQLTARFDKFPTKAEAYQNLAHWGNQVIIGQPWAEVAKAHSHGATASQGGAFNWTKKGSLVSKPLDEAIFALPVGSLSPIIEDAQGFHIVRVVERKEGGRTPFTEAQGAIKRKILEERGEAARKEYVAKIRKSAIVWNAFDDPATAPKYLATPPTAAPARR